MSSARAPEDQAVTAAHDGTVAGPGEAASDKSPSDSALPGVPLKPHGKVMAVTTGTSHTDRL